MIASPILRRLQQYWQGTSCELNQMWSNFAPNLDDRSCHFSYTTKLLVWLTRIPSSFTQLSKSSDLGWQKKCRMQGPHVCCLTNLSLSTNCSCRVILDHKFCSIPPHVYVLKSEHFHFTLVGPCHTFSFDMMVTWKKQIKSVVILQHFVAYMHSWIRTRYLSNFYVLTESPYYWQRSSERVVYQHSYLSRIIVHPEG